MSEIRLYREQKYEVWEREYYTIEAETEEEAVKILNEEREMVDSDEVEIIYETMEVFPLKENKGQSTIEIFSEDGNLLYANNE